MYVNGSAQANVSFAGTGSWSNWVNTANINVNLQAGTNRVRVQATNRAGLPNVDNLRITGANISTGICQ
jgi:hypothetical protein